MKLPSLFKMSGLAKGAEAQDHAEKLLADSFRMLSQVCTKMAEYVEAQRLTRQGYETQGKFLERLEKKDGSQGNP
jgi:ribose 1,5-bisphosphokinase PhnN